MWLKAADSHMKEREGECVCVCVRSQLGEAHVCFNHVVWINCIRQRNRVYKLKFINKIFCIVTIFIRGEKSHPCSLNVLFI